MCHIFGQKIPLFLTCQKHTHFQVHKSVENQAKNRENAEEDIDKLKLIIPQIIGKRRILPFYGTRSKTNGEKQAENLTTHACSEVKKQADFSPGEGGAGTNRSLFWSTREGRYSEDRFQGGSRGGFAKKAGKDGSGFELPRSILRGNRVRFGRFPFFWIVRLFLRLLDDFAEIPAIHLMIIPSFLSPSNTRQTSKSEGGPKRKTIPAGATGMKATKEAGKEDMKMAAFLKRENTKRG